MTEKRTPNSNGGVSPAARLVTNLDGKYYMLSEVAEILDKSTQTIRRSMKKVNAPSRQVRQGGMVVYLYSEDDIQELRDYFAPQITMRKRK